MESPLELRNLLTFKTLIYMNGLKTLKVNIFPLQEDEGEGAKVFSF